MIITAWQTTPFQVKLDLSELFHGKPVERQGRKAIGAEAGAANASQLPVHVIVNKMRPSFITGGRIFWC